MEPLVSIIMAILFLGVSYLIYLMFKKHKYYWIPSLGLINAGIILLVLPSLNPDISGWNDLGYVILAIFLFLVSIALSIIIALFRYFKYRKI